MFGALALGVFSLAGAAALGVVFGIGVIEGLSPPARDVRQERPAPHVPQLITRTPIQKPPVA